MGVQRLGHQGLCVPVIGLLTALPLSAGLGQARPYSLDDIVELVANRVPRARIVQLVRTDCIAFQLDSVAESRLGAAGADPLLVADLREVCYAGSLLQVTTEPPGVEVWVGARLAGRSPIVDQLVPDSGVVVEARTAQWVSRVSVNLPRRQLVSVHFDVPGDTLPWPVARPQEEIAQTVLANWRPPKVPPPMPLPPPNKPGSAGRWILGIGGIVGGAVLGHRARPDSAVYAVIGGAAGGLVGVLLGAGLDNAAHRGSVRKYEQSVRDHPAALALWQAQMAADKNRWLQRELPIALEQERRRVDAESARVRAENEKIQVRNRTVREPLVTTGPIRR